MKLLIVYILIIIQSINALNPLLDVEYIRKGLTSPPTTIYSISYFTENLIRTVSRNDIQNNSKSIKLFNEFPETRLPQGEIMLIPNNETIIFMKNDSFDEPKYWRRGWTNNDYPIQFDLKVYPLLGQEGNNYYFPSISIEDSNDYFNITGIFYIRETIHFSLSSSLNDNRKFIIKTDCPLTYLYIYHDKLSHLHYLVSKQSSPDLYLVIVDTKNLSSNTLKITNYKEPPQSIGAYKKWYYFGKSFNNSKSYSIYKYDLSNIESMPEKTIDSENFSLELVTTIVGHEISFVIPCTNLNFLILYSKPSQILFMYNIDESTMEKYYNFSIQEPTSDQKFTSFFSTSGPPIEPEEEKKKLNILIPILCSIIGFSLLVFAIILTIFLVKRKNYKNSMIQTLKLKKIMNQRSQTNKFLLLSL